MTSIASLTDIIRVKIHPQSVAPILALSEIDRSLIPVIVLLEAHVCSNSTLGKADNSTGLRNVNAYRKNVMEMNG